MVTSLSHPLFINGKHFMVYLTAHVTVQYVTSLNLLLVA